MELSNSDLDAVGASPPPPGHWQPAHHPARPATRLLACSTATHLAQTDSPDNSREEGQGALFKPDPEQPGTVDAEHLVDPVPHGPEAGGSWEPHVVPFPLELRRLGPPPEISGPCQATSRAIADLWNQLAEQSRPRRPK